MLDEYVDLDSASKEFDFKKLKSNKFDFKVAVCRWGRENDWWRTKSFPTTSTRMAKASYTQLKSRTPFNYLLATSRSCHVDQLVSRLAFLSFFATDCIWVWKCEQSSIEEPCADLVDIHRTASCELSRSVWHLNQLTYYDFILGHLQFHSCVSVGHQCRWFEFGSSIEDLRLQLLVWKVLLVGEGVHREIVVIWLACFSSTIRI
jgi:hypothetical protein